MDRQITTDDGVALWTDSGGSGPNLALAHGGPGLWDYLQELAGLLEPFATVHRWDQRGCGRSQPSGPFTADRFVRDMDEVRTSAGAERWIAGGHSWGAVMSLLYALRYPDRTLGVLYIAGNGLEWDRWKAAHKQEFEKRLGPQRLGQFKDTKDESESNRLRWSVDYASDDIAKPEVDRMLATGFRVNQECNRAIGSDMTANSAHYFSSVSKLDVPVLIVQGRLDPRPLDACDSLEARLPNVNRVVIDGAGHFPWVEQPTKVVGLVSDWIAGLR